MTDFAEVGRELRCSDEEGEDPDRDVYVEHPAPRQIVDEEATEERAEHRRNSEHRSEEPHVSAAVARERLCRPRSPGLR